MKAFNEKHVGVAKFNKQGDEGLHGDVIVTMEKLPSNFETMPIVKDACIAYGEATGHAHKIFGSNFELRECPKTKVRHLRVVEPVMLKHQEHDAVTIPPGEYRIGIQKEYDPFDKLTRQVAD